MTDPADLFFARHRLPVSTRNRLGNLRHVAGKYACTLAGKPLAGVPAFICGAGPSLAKNGHLLAEAKKRGAVFAVNASAKAVLRAAGVSPHVVVSREALAVAGHLDGVQPEAIVADLQSHPDAFARATHWFHAHNLNTAQLTRTIGVRPLHAGTAALTAAVSLAVQWGASRIVLVGTDLAFAPDGNGYAPGSPWEGMGGKVEGDRVSLGGSGLEAMHEAADAIGQRPSVGTEEAACPAPGWGGGPTVYALDTWEHQADWLATWAARWGAQTINATEGGRDIDGWDAMQLEAVLGACNEATLINPWTCPSAVLTEEHVARVRATIRARARRVHSIATDIRNGSATWSQVPHFIDGCSEAEALNVPRQMDAGDMDLEVRTDWIYAGLQQAAREVEEALK